MTISTDFSKKNVKNIDVLAAVDKYAAEVALAEPDTRPLEKREIFEKICREKKISEPLDLLETYMKVYLGDIKRNTRTQQFENGAEILTDVEVNSYFLDVKQAGIKISKDLFTTYL